MQSAACEAALSRLARLDRVADSPAQAAAPAASAPAAADRLQARREAAVACLGAAALHPPPRVGQLQAPISVPPVPAASRGAAPAGSGGAGSVVRPPGLVTVTSCDANGCWASDGTRLTRDGLLLQGPRGTCSTTGAVLNCP